VGSAGSRRAASRQVLSRGMETGTPPRWPLARSRDARGLPASHRRRPRAERERPHGHGGVKCQQPGAAEPPVPAPGARSRSHGLRNRAVTARGEGLSAAERGRRAGGRRLCPRRHLPGHRRSSSARLPGDGAAGRRPIRYGSSRRRAGGRLGPVRCEGPPLSRPPPLLRAHEAFGHGTHGTTGVGAPGHSRTEPGVPAPVPPAAPAPPGTEGVTPGGRAGSCLRGLGASWPGSRVGFETLGLFLSDVTGIQLRRPRVSLLPTRAPPLSVPVPGRFLPGARLL